MLNKIYLALLAFAILISAFFTYYSYSWLGSIGSPEIAAENYGFYSGIGWTFLWLSYIALAIFSAVMIWKKGKSKSLWGAYVYFVVFVTLQTFWLAPTFQGFLTNNNLAEQSYTFSPVLGSVIIVIVAIATFFTQFIIQRMRDKIVGDDVPETENGSVK